MKRLQEGSKVLCRLYNTPDQKFYGDYFTATVDQIIPNHKFNAWMVETGYLVIREDATKITLHRKEIKRIIH